MSSDERYPTPFTPEIEALCYEIKLEQLIWKEIGRLSVHLDLVRGYPLTLEEEAGYAHEFKAQIRTFL